MEEKIKLYGGVVCREEYDRLKRMPVPDGESALAILPRYAFYETNVGTKGGYADIFDKLMKADSKDPQYLLALMETEEEMAETIYEYRAGIRERFRLDLPEISEKFQNGSTKDRVFLLKAVVLACKNRTLSAYKVRKKADELFDLLSKETLEDPLVKEEFQEAFCLWKEARIL